MVHSLLTSDNIHAGSGPGWICHGHVFTQVVDQGNFSSLLLTPKQTLKQKLCFPSEAFASQQRFNQIWALRAQNLVEKLLGSKSVAWEAKIVLQSLLGRQKPA